MTNDLETGQEAAPLPPSAARLAELLRQIWSATTRATRRMEHLPTLPGQHVEVLHRVTEAGGLTPAQLAEAMQLSRSTISELVRRMAADGLVERRPSENDGRSIVLMPTDRARHLLSTFGHGVADVITSALAGVSAREARQLLAVIPALEHLQQELQAIAGSAESGTPSLRGTLPAEPEQAAG